MMYHLFFTHSMVVENLIARNWVDSGSNAVNDEEIERLKTLVTQLVDRRFDDPYIQTQDAKINEMTATIVSQRKKLAEKEASLRSLEQEESEVEQAIVEIKKNITNAMDNIHKAEITQEQYYDFYRHISHAFDDPWDILHYKIRRTGTSPQSLLRGERTQRLYR